MFKKIKTQPILSIIIVIEFFILLSIGLNLYEELSINKQRISDNNIVDVSDKYEDLKLNISWDDVEISKSESYYDDFYIMYVKNKNDRYEKKYLLYKPEFIKDNKPYLPNFKEDVVQKAEIKNIVIVNNGKQTGAHKGKIYFY